MPPPRPRRFLVRGPFGVPTRGATGAKALDRQRCRQFWVDDAKEWAKERGCYVFALRAGRGYRLLYVGRTTDQTFDRECFSDRNYRLLHEAMDGRAGTLVLFLLAYETTPGKFNKHVVEDLEKFLVEVALERNPELKNTVYTRKVPGFVIPGVHRSPPGPPGKAATELKRALGL